MIKKQNKIKEIVKKYADELKKNNFSFKAIYLFGSYAKNNEHQWSDIDVAVISDKLKRNWEKNELLLWRLRRNIDSRIEPIGFTSKDFQDKCDPMVY
ncbi:MAG: nucleotidyltransferase domain-containing protein [Candidatus Kuenenbacteria bacterium]